LWTKEALYDLIQARLHHHQFIVVANREPYIHRYAGDQIEWVKTATSTSSKIFS
jgi:trehalose 6-phosphate synthase